MKYLVLILIVVVVLWLARASRRVPPPAAPRDRAQPPKKEAMLECAQCGLHLPRGEALPGRGGVFCSDAHRADYEKAHPPK